MYRLFIFIIVLSFAELTVAQGLNVNIQQDKACFVEGMDSILCYQITEKSYEGTYKRSNYIHPLYTLDGEVLSEDFPEDHLHHRGIFWSWHQLYVGEKRIGDPWEIKGFCWEVKSVKEVKKQIGAISIQSEVHWKSPLWQDEAGLEKPVVKEMTTIIVHPKQDNYRLIDIEISLLALEKDMRIGGSEDPKGYGGFSPRIRLVADTEFTNAKGSVTPNNLPVPESAWMDISGSVGKDNAKAGMSILSHPDNPGYPNPWILRAKTSMQNAVYPYPGAEAVALSNTVPTVLRYRLVVHEGGSSDINITQLHSEYAKD
jgi:hypothetical protein